jgi:hypothetical protein
MKCSFILDLSTLFVVLILLQLITLPLKAGAVLPPDLIVSAGAQVVGMFSLVAAVVVSLFASLVVLYVSWYQWFKKWSAYIAFGILALTLLLSNALLIWQLHATNQPVIITPTPSGLPVPQDRLEEVGSDCLTCQFYSDRITIFLPAEENFAVVDLDLNRRQEPDKSFSHYYFLDGFLRGQSLDTYAQFSKNEHELKSSSFLEKISVSTSVDASVRRSYEGVVLVQGTQLKFTTAEVLADFVTRNMPEYTQFQSPVAVDVHFDGEKRKGYALVETLLSDDYEQRIFFPGYETLEALTHQFVLWDSEGSFYMIDNTEVFSDTPAYPSHSWLLYKNADTQTTKKGFKTEVRELSENSWSVTVPDFADGLITVSAVQTYKDNKNGRTGKIVAGTISDSEGKREISGLIRIVK